MVINTWLIVVNIHVLPEKWWIDSKISVVFFWFKHIETPIFCGYLIYPQIVKPPASTTDAFPAAANLSGKCAIQTLEINHQKRWKVMKRGDLNIKKDETWWLNNQHRWTVWILYILSSKETVIMVFNRPRNGNLIINKRDLTWLNDI